MKSSGSERLQDHQRDDERDECDSRSMSPEHRPSVEESAEPIRDPPRLAASSEIPEPYRTGQVQQLQNGEERDWRTSPSGFEPSALIAMRSSRPELKAVWRGSSAFATASTVRAAR